MVCETCWPGVRADLGAAAAAKPALAEMANADVLVGDLYLGPNKANAESKIDLGLGEAALGQRSCGECGAGPFGILKPVRGCFNCSKLICNSAACGGTYSSASVEQGRGVTLCGTCAPAVLGIEGAAADANLSGGLKLGGLFGGGGGRNKAGVTVKPELSGLALGADAKAALGAKGAGCGVCFGQYGALRRAQGRCSECLKETCNVCLKKVQLETLGDDIQAICVGCVPAVKSKVEAAVEANPELQAQGVLDVASLDFALAGPEQGYGKVEMSAAELEWASSGKGKCNVCMEAFTVVRGPVKCAECGQLACREDVIRSDLYGLLGGCGSQVCRQCCPKACARLQGASSEHQGLQKAVREETERIDAWLGGQLTEGQAQRADWLTGIWLYVILCAFRWCCLGMFLDGLVFCFLFFVFFFFAFVFVVVF